MSLAKFVSNTKYKLIEQTLTKEETGYRLKLMEKIHVNIKKFESIKNIGSEKEFWMRLDQEEPLVTEYLTDLNCPKLEKTQLMDSFLLELDSVEKCQYLIFVLPKIFS